MTREEKEVFVRENWDKYKTPEDQIPLPNLTNMTEGELDAMVIWFKYLNQK